MKKTIVIFLLFLNLSVLIAGPKYTDIQNARSLASVLMHASIGEDFLVAIDIKKVSNEKYYLEGIAQSGKIYKLFISYLQSLSRKEKIFLRGNKVLVFPFSASSSFVVLDRKEFRKVALNAKSYLKYYSGDDPLAGQSILHDIKAIDIVPYAVESRLGSNLQGNIYHYSIELHNGEKDYITYYDAYKLLEEQKLLAGTYPEVQAMDKVYSIENVQFQKLDLNLGGTPQFSIRLTLAQDNLLTEDMIGIEILEQKKYKDYLLYITIPNTVISRKFDLATRHEYLKDIDIVNDSRYISRTLLKMRFNPLLTNLAPHISKFGKRDIFITFFYRNSYNSVAKQEEKAISFSPFFEVDKKEQASFTSVINTHRATLKRIRAEKNVVSLASQVQELVANINQDGVNVTSDKHLNLLFELRQQARSLGFNRILNSVQQTLGEDKPSPSSTEYTRLLEVAEEFTGDREKIEMLRELKRRISN